MAERPQNGMIGLFEDLPSYLQKGLKAQPGQHRNRLN